MSYFKYVDALLRKYHKEHDITRVEISVDKLRPFFEEMGYVDKILWEKFDFNSRIILAQIKTYEAQMGAYKDIGTYARIQISSGQNYCWKRFILCKEMYHCILDEEQENRITDTSSLLKLTDYFTNSFLDRIADENGTFKPFVTEEDAEVMALETLFPMELRRSFCDDLDDGKITAYQLALRFRIPEVYVQTAMVDSYYSAVSRGRDLINTD